MDCFKLTDSDCWVYITLHFYYREDNSRGESTIIISLQSVCYWCNVVSWWFWFSHMTRMDRLWSTYFYRCGWDSTTLIKYKSVAALTLAYTLVFDAKICRECWSDSRRNIEMGTAFYLRLVDGDLLLAGWDLLLAGWDLLLEDWDLLLADCDLFLADWDLFLAGWDLWLMDWDLLLLLGCLLFVLSHLPLLADWLPLERASLSTFFDWNALVDLGLPLVVDLLGDRWRSPWPSFCFKELFRLIGEPLTSEVEKWLYASMICLAVKITCVVASIITTLSDGKK